MLNIYRASAGAGKTHLLTGEYIKLLFRKDLQPAEAEHDTRFDEILAVTFTNKSTAEMKSRIVKELHQLCQNPTESHYYKDVKYDKIGGTLSDDEIKAKAKAILTEILNNYSDFAISTIDSFFQKIVRSFARELNLPSNYEVELNANRILDAAVSSFIEKLSLSHRSQTFDWMMQFSNKKIEEGAGWRLERDLAKLAKSVLTTEDYRTRSEAINLFTNDKKGLRQYVDMLNDIVRTMKDKLKSLGEEGVRVIGDQGMTVYDFKSGVRSKMRLFEMWRKGEMKVPDEEFEKWANDNSLWYAKTAKIKLDKAHSQKLMSLMQEAVEMKYDGSFVNYNSALIIRENIYQLGILADIDSEVIEYCNQEGSMLLSSTTEMLNKLISQDDAPFIYEKTGTKIHSFMIDEFQDTSQMQWNNFRSLIENSLGDGRQNLIVGDVKQSIYRWRGSDWGLLHSGLRNFARGLSLEDTTTLKTNYRSQKEIITFNNSFFQAVANELSKVYGSEDITEIYKDVDQKIPDNKNEDSPGVVHLRFMKVKEDQKFVDLAMAQIPEAVMRLEDSGFEAKDIAILCRTRSICKKVADALLGYKSSIGDTGKYVFDIISSEALLLSSRHIILTIISIMKYIQKPESKLIRATASCNYLQECGMDEQESVSATFSGDTDIDKFLSLANRSLYDMTEGIISLLPSAGHNIAFVQAFRDCVMDYCNSKKADLSLFLEWWEQYGGDLCITTPEGQNAIRIMTIHKSKGLGMPAVILPYCEGTTDMKNRGDDILWCQPKKDSPFYRDGLFLPIKCSKKLTDTIFKEDYQAERQKAIIDNLNTIYVAYTRAKEAMVLIAPLSKTERKKDEGVTQDELLYTFIKNQNYVTKETDDAIDCVIGEYSRKKNFDKDNEQKAEAITQDATDLALQRKLPMLSLKHDKLTKNIEAIDRGNCIHEALSAIIDRENIDEPIEELYRLGRINDEIMTCEEMKAEIHRLMDIAEIGRWFEPGQKILNEKTILARTKNYEGMTKDLSRPDRVVCNGKEATVIDYKTGEKRRSHANQVREYMNLLRQMGFEKVEGYLWYIYPHEVVKVENKGYKKA